MNLKQAKRLRKFAALVAGRDAPARQLVTKLHFDDMGQPRGFSLVNLQGTFRSVYRRVKAYS